MALISIDLGLIGDAHGNLPFQMQAVITLEKHNVTCIVRCGNFGLLWSGAAHELEGVPALNLVLEAMGLDFFVVLENHENHDLIDAHETEPDGTRRIGRVVILPRSARLTAAVRPAGFLAGAGSTDRYYRIPWQSWWSQELPTDDEALALVDQDDAPGKIDILFAHDALRGPALQRRLLATRHLWREDGLSYAKAAAELFTERALSVLSDGGVVVSGHYHFRHSAEKRWSAPTARSSGRAVKCSPANGRMAPWDCWMRRRSSSRRGLWTRRTRASTTTRSAPYRSIGSSS